MGIVLFVDRKAVDPRRYFTLTDPATGTTEDHWLALRSELSDAEASKIQGAMIQSVTVDDDQKSVEVRLNKGAARTLKLTMWISEWSFTDADGRGVPPDTQHIELLPTWVADVVSGIVDDHAAGVNESRSARRFTAEDAPSPLAPAASATLAVGNGPTAE